MPNNRIYYAIQQVSIAGTVGGAGLTNFNAVHGLQSVGVTTNYNLTPVFEYGQLSLYDNVEEIPEVQITLNKVCDGYSPIWCMATMDAANPSLAARAVTSCQLNLDIFNESLQAIAGANPITSMTCPKMYPNNIRFQFPKDGNFTEEMTLVGNNKLWSVDGNPDTRIINATDAALVHSEMGNAAFDGEDAPNTITHTVNKRADIIFGTDAGATNATTGAALNTYITVLPQNIRGIETNGCNDITDDVNGHAHINNISVSVGLTRDDFTELGRRQVYFKNPKFPIEVTTEIETTSTDGDYDSASEGGILSLTNDVGCGNFVGNLTNYTIRVVICAAQLNYLTLFMGNKNKLSAVNYTGGDTGGGNVNVTFTYKNYNDFTVIADSDDDLSGLNAFLGIAMLDRSTYLN